MTAAIDPLATGLGRGAVLLGPRGAVLVLRLLVTAQHTARQDGIAPPVDVSALRAVLDQAVVEARSFATESAKLSQVSGGASSMSAPSSSVLIDPIDCDEAAALLGCSVQWARALCRRGVFASAQRRAGGWWVERSEVASRVG